MKSNSTISMIVIVACIVILGFLLVAPKLMKGPPVDPDTGCTGDIPRRTVILLDHSEQISSQTRNEIFTRAMRASTEKAITGELISIFYASSLSKKDLTPVFSRCKPKVDVNPLTESERVVMNNYKKKYIAPLENAITADITGSKESPLAQAIVDLSLIDQLRTNTPANLIVFSDMWEYTDKFSLYNCESSRNAIASYQASRGANTSRPKFRNVNIELNVIPREVKGVSSQKCRDGFWAWFFGDNEGPHSSLSKLDLPG